VRPTRSSFVTGALAEETTSLHECGLWVAGESAEDTDPDERAIRVSAGNSFLKLMLGGGNSKTFSPAITNKANVASTWTTTRSAELTTLTALSGFGEEPATVTGPFDFSDFFRFIILQRLA